MRKPKQGVGTFLIILFIMAVLPGLTLQSAVAQSSWVDLGEGAPGESSINALLGIPNGRVIGGTYGSGSPYLFKYDIATATFTPKLLVPGGASYVSRLVWHSNGLVYATTSETYSQGRLGSYDPDADEIVDLGSFGDEYGDGLTIGLDSKVYISTCCQGKMSIYDPQAHAWTYKSAIISGQVRINALATGVDGNIYGATSRIWVPPYGSAVLFKFNTLTQSATVIGTIWPGAREVWNLVWNPVDQRLYGAVGYEMTPRLFTFAPAHPELGIMDLGEVPGPATNVGPGSLVVAVDGKVYGIVSGHLIMYDYAHPDDGIVDLGPADTGAPPLSLGSDARLYGRHSTNITHLARNNALFAPTLDLPFEYPGRTAGTADRFRSAYIARTTSVFDHNLPNNLANREMLPYLGYIVVSYPETKFPCGPPSYKCYDGHDAHDFSQTRAGDIVLAAAAGTVDDANTGCGFCLGCQVTIDHGNGFKTVYGHLRDAPTVTGQVQAGDVVGIIGSTYNAPCTSTGPHLHFDVKYSGVSLDPSGWLDSSHPDPWALQVGGGTSYNLWKHPVPTSERWSVDGESGGTYTSASGSTTFEVPRDAFTGTWQFDFMDAPVAEPSAQLKPTGHSFTLAMSESVAASSNAPSLSLAFTLTVYYTDTEIVDLDEDSLQLYRWDTGSPAWVPLETTLDTTENVAVAATLDSGLFALLADDNDNQGPIIGEPLFQDQISSTEWLTISVPISDTLTGDHGVDSATLYYSYTLPYTQAEVVGSAPGFDGDGVWLFAIPPQGDEHRGEVLHFSIVARDGDLSPSESCNDNSGSYFAVKILSDARFQRYLPLVVRQH
jgi:hypothetical protein